MMTTTRKTENLEQRFCRWIEEYQRLLFRVVHSSADNTEDKKDLLQEILLQLWRSLPSFKERCKETTWIYRVALNTALAWSRSEKRRRTRHEEVTAFTELLTMTQAAADPLLEQLYEAIKRMPKADASLLMLHLDGLTYQDIADVLGISESNVGVRLTRARKLLTERMKGQINDD